MNYQKAHGEWDFGTPRSRIVRQDGYVLLYVPGHPQATKQGYVPEHRWVMEQSIGRYLEKFEKVHHMNGRRGDNRIENLELWKTRKDPAGVRYKDYHCAGCRCAEMGLEGTLPEPVYQRY